MPSPLDPAAPPFVPATPSPPSLDSLTVADDSPVAPWNRLPVELKQKIIDEVLKRHEQDHVDLKAVSDANEAVGYFARRECLEDAACDADYEKERELERLQAVSRDFRSICEPMLWQRIIVDDLCPAQLDNLLEVIPPHAPLVRYVDLAAVENEYSHMKVHDTHERSEVRRRALELLEHCVDVRELVLDETALELSAVALASLRIVDLRTEGFHMVDIDATLDVLGKQASLVSFGLRVDDAQDELRVALVGDIVSRLSSLKHLKIDGDLILGDRCLEMSPGAAVTARLESLELVGATSITFTALHAFVALFSTSLIELRLELDNGFVEQWPVPSSSPDFRLPHLTSLALGSAFDSTLFLRLDLPSLAFFRLELFPALREDTGHLVIFLRKHARTLKHVHLAYNAVSSTEWDGDLEGTELSEADVEEVERVCAEIKCEFSIGELDDPDGLEEDDSDSWDSDYERRRQGAMEESEEEESDDEDAWARRAYRYDDSSDD
ncbi:hypothetical protein JCM8208_000138 [Rhodotorula glutinis]